MKLFRFREIQRGVQRENPSGSLSAVRQGGLGAASPVSKGRAGGNQGYLPYGDYAGGEDLSKSEQLPGHPSS